MHIEIINKDSFCVIGKKGSTDMGTGFIQKLWNEANTHFNEISNLVKRDDEEKPLACWGAMSDFSMSFMPWENNFTRGKYLAGAECLDEALAPEGWVKWTVPDVYKRQPLQLIAYYTSVLKGNDVDKPRNLAKSVTVE